MALVDRRRHEKEKHPSRLTFGVGHVFLHGIVECLNFDLSWGKFDKTITSLVILESNPIKFSDGQPVDCIEVSLIREKGLFVNNRQGLLIHPLVLTMKQEEQQAGTQE